MDPKLERELTIHRENRIKAKALELIASDPVTFLMGIVNSPDNDAKTRVDAAKALLPYFHSKKPVESIITSVNEITTIERKII